MNKLNVKFVKPNMDFKDIISDSMNGRYSPCKKCHSRIVQTVYEEAKREDVKIIFFGDLLPTGSHSLRIIDKMLRVNFPAFLALSKKYRSSTDWDSIINGINKIDIESYGQGETAETIQHSDKDPQILVDFLDSFLDLNNYKNQEKDVIVKLRENHSKVTELRLELLSLDETKRAQKSNYQAICLQRIRKIQYSG